MIATKEYQQEIGATAAYVLGKYIQLDLVMRCITVKTTKMILSSSCSLEIADLSLSNMLLIYGIQGVTPN